MDCGWLSTGWGHLTGSVLILLLPLAFIFLVRDNCMTVIAILSALALALIVFWQVC